MVAILPFWLPNTKSDPKEYPKPWKVDFVDLAKSMVFTMRMAHLGVLGRVHWRVLCLFYLRPSLKRVLGDLLADLCDLYALGGPNVLILGLVFGPEMASILLNVQQMPILWNEGPKKTPRPWKYLQNRWKLPKPLPKHRLLWPFSNSCHYSPIAIAITIVNPPSSIL